MSKITLNDVNKMVSLSPTDKVEILFDTVDGDKITVKVKPYLSLLELSDIIDTSVNACFTSEGFAPEYKDVVFAWKVIDVMTDLPKLITKEKTADLAKTYEIVTKLNLIDTIMGADKRLFDLILKLNTMIDNKLEFQKSLICHPDRDNDIVNAVVGFFDKLNSVISNLEKNFGNIDMEKALPVIGDMAKSIAEGKALSRENIQTILEVGSASKVGSENVPNLEVVKPEVIE